MSWYSDGETPSRWYLERTGDGDDYPDDEVMEEAMWADREYLETTDEEGIIADNLYLQ